MKRIHVLTPEETQFAEKNHYLVNRFLRNNGLDEAEFYDVVIFGYLRAVQDYLTQPSLQEYQFSTIARRGMKNSLVDEFIYQNRPKRNAPKADYHENYESASLEDLLPNRMERMAEILDNQNYLCLILSHLTPKEKEAVYLKADGYTYREIGEICGITRAGVETRITRLRRRLRNLELAE